MNNFMFYVTTEFGYLFLDSHQKSDFSPFGVQFDFLPAPGAEKTSCSVLPRSPSLALVLARRGVSRISGTHALSSPPVLSNLELSKP